MAVTVITKKGKTMRVNKEEFATLMRVLWERAQARKAAREDISAHIAEEKAKRNN